MCIRSHIEVNDNVSVCHWNNTQQLLNFSTFSMMNTSTVTGRESSHIWLCDDRGDVFVLRDFHVYKDSIKVNLRTREEITQTTHTDAPPPSWLKVASGFNAIVGGCSGLVCGIQKRNLCVRLGLTHDNPAGNSWVKVHSEAVEMAIGASFVVRRTSAGKLFYVDMTNYDLMQSKSVLALSWHVIPPCPGHLWKDGEGSEPLYMSLDENDNFFLIDCTGNVRMYTLSSVGATWSKLCNAPVVPKKWGIVNWLAKALWREDEEQKCHFLGASMGQRVIWCLDSEPRVVWQLVLSYVTSRAGGRTVKTNWVRCELPTEDELMCFCADKCTVDGLLLAAKNQDDSDTFFLYCSLNETVATPVEIPSPSTWSNSCNSLSICRTSVDSVPSYYVPEPIQSSAQPLTQPLAEPGTSGQSGVQMLYPVLNLEDTDHSVCCETGDCYFCRKAASQPTLSEVLNDTEYPTRKRKRVESASEEGFVPKRARSMPHTYHGTLDGVGVMVTPPPESSYIEVCYDCQ